MGELVNLRPIPAPDAFDRFWAAYPKKHKIGPAKRQWLWALVAVNNDAEQLIAGAARYAAYCKRQGTEECYIAAAHNWLMDERWLDVYEQPQGNAELTEEARIRALHTQWWGGPDNAFKREWRENRISEADKAAMRRMGLEI